MHARCGDDGRRTTDDGTAKTYRTFLSCGGVGFLLRLVELDLHCHDPVLQLVVQQRLSEHIEKEYDFLHCGGREHGVVQGVVDPLHELFQQVFVDSGGQKSEAVLRNGDERVDERDTGAVTVLVMIVRLCGEGARKPGDQAVEEADF